MFNCQKEPFNDKRVRQAFHYAIDYDKLIKNQLGGNAETLTSYLPKDNPAYHEASTVYKYDPEKAKALAQGGRPGEPRGQAARHRQLDQGPVRSDPAGTCRPSA